jgi:hypothetical protein
LNFLCELVEPGAHTTCESSVGRHDERELATQCAIKSSQLDRACPQSAAMAKTNLPPAEIVSFEAANQKAEIIARL